MGHNVQLSTDSIAVDTRGNVLWKQRLSNKFLMCFVLKEGGTFIGRREDLPTNCSEIKKRQILDETGKVMQRRWQKTVVISVWLEWKLCGEGEEIGIVKWMEIVKVFVYQAKNCSLCNGGKKH